MTEKIKFGDYEFEWDGDHEEGEFLLHVTSEPQPIGHYPDGSVECDQGGYICFDGEEVLRKLCEIIEKKLPKQKKKTDWRVAGTIIRE